MNKTFFATSALALTCLLASCEANQEVDFTPTEIPTRAEALGFDNTDDYNAWACEEHNQGNHENCDIAADGSHQVCDDVDHCGQNYDGTQHEGNRHHGTTDITCEPDTCTNAGQGYGTGCNRNQNNSQGHNGCGNHNR